MPLKIKLKLAPSIVLMVSLGLGEISQAGEFPTAFFQAIYWQPGEPDTLCYAPWGNALEENASLVEVQVSSSVLSRKFAYYGKIGRAHV